MKGWLGEQIVNLLARFFLDKKIYRVIKNVTLPTEDSTTQIDHIIVSKYGLFVVETKNMGGSIHGSSDNKEWTQQVNKQKNKFENPLRQNYRHTKTLEEIVGLMPNRIFSVIVFVGESTFKTAMPENVVHAGGYIRYIKSKTEPIFGDFEVEEIIRKIKDYRLDPGIKNHRLQIENLKSQHSRKINRKLRRAKSIQPSPLYKFAVIAAVLLVFAGVAKKTIFTIKEEAARQNTEPAITASAVVPEASQEQRERNRIYQYTDAQGRTRYTNDATAPNARLVDRTTRVDRELLPVTIDDDKILVPVTIRNKGMEMETMLIFDEKNPITILPNSMAHFLDAENLGSATVIIDKGKIVTGEKRRVSYFAVGDRVEQGFIFLAVDGGNFAETGILGKDFFGRHPFSIDHKKQMLIWK